MKEFLKKFIPAFLIAYVVFFAIAALIGFKTAKTEALLGDFSLFTYSGDRLYGIGSLPFHQYVLHVETPGEEYTDDYYVDLKLKDHGKEPQALAVTESGAVCILWCKDPDRADETVLVTRFDPATEKNEEICRTVTESETERTFALSTVGEKVTVSEIVENAQKETTVSQTEYSRGEGGWIRNDLQVLSWFDRENPLAVQVSDNGELWAFDELGDVFRVEGADFSAVFINDESQVSRNNVGYSCYAGNAAFYNLDEDIICFAGNESELKTLDLMTLASYENNGYKVQRIYSEEEKSLFAELRGKEDEIIVFHMDAEGTERTITGAAIPFVLCLPTVLIATLFLVLAIFVLIAVILSVAWFLKREDVMVPTVVSIICTAVPVFMVGFLIIDGQVGRDFESHWRDQYSRMLKSQAAVTVLKVDDDKFREWPVDGEYFRELAIRLDTASTNEEADEYVGLTEYGKVEHRFFTVHEGNIYMHGGFTIGTVPAQYYMTKSQTELLTAVLLSPDMDGEIYDDGADQLVVYRVLRENGEVVGVVECLTDLDRIRAASEQSTGRMMSVMRVIYALLLSAVFLYIGLSLKPLGVLNKSIQKIEEGESGGKIEVSGTSDLESMIALYNRLSSRLEIYSRTMGSMEDLFGGFIPAAFLEELEEKNGGKLKPGDGVRRFGTGVHVYRKQKSFDQNEDLALTTEQESGEKEDEMLAFHSQIEALEQRGAEFFTLSSAGYWVVFNQDAGVDVNFLKEFLSEDEEMEVLRGEMLIYLTGTPERMAVSGKEA